MADSDSMLLNDAVKQYCGLSADDTSFDVIFESSLGASMLKLRQLGGSFIPPEKGPYLKLSLEDIGANDPGNPVVEYLCLNARLAYDPPSGAQIMQAIKDEIAQLEFRLSVN